MIRIHAMQWKGLLLCAVLLILLPVNGSAKTIQIKLATLAPEGSPWVETFNAIKADLKKETNNRIRLKIYPGGVLGDETDMLRKMNIGQIHGAVLTSSGLATISPEIKTLQIPFLFQTYDEVDHVLDQVGPLFRKSFESKGYHILGWSEAGFVHIMSAQPGDTIEKLKQMKVWIWEDAPMAKAIFDQARISAIPLSIPDVLMGLQTGMVDVVYAPPTVAIAMQWFTKTKYMTDVPLIYMLGGIVVSQKILATLEPAQQVLLEDIFARQTAHLKVVLREQNQEAIRVMADYGITMLKCSPDEVRHFKEISNEALKNMRDSNFSAKTVDEVKTILDTYRKAHP